MGRISSVRVYEGLNTFNGERVYIVTEFKEANHYVWLGHVLILSNIVKIQDPLIELSLSSETVQIKLSEFHTTSEAFEKQLREYGSNQFELSFFEQNEKEYLAANRLGINIEFKEIENAEFGLVIIANDRLNGSIYNAQLQRLSKKAFSNDLKEAISNAQNFALTVRILP